MNAPTVAPIPRLALSIEEACLSLNVSRDFFDEHIRNELRFVRRGRKRLIPVSEIQRWFTDNSSRTL